MLLFHASPGISVRGDSRSGFRTLWPTATIHLVDKSILAVVLKGFVAPFGLLLTQSDSFNDIMRLYGEIEVDAHSPSTTSNAVDNRSARPLATGEKDRR